MPLKKKKRPLVKKKVVRKPVKKTRKIKAAAKPKKEEVVGIITHYFPHVKAAVLKLKLPLKAGETIKIKGHTTDFKQQVSSMQIEHTPITIAKKGDEIGLLVESRVRRKDKVFKAKP